MQDAPAVFQQHLARLGEGDATPVADQQILAQLHFQAADLAAQGGLSHVQYDGGAGEAAQLGHPDKIFQLCQIHGCRAGRPAREGESGKVSQTGIAASGPMRFFRGAGRATMAPMQTPIKTCFMRGGTSRGPFFNAADLPADLPTRDQVLLAVMGSPDRRQIDGLGGAHPLTSKVGIVSRSSREGVDLEFLFAQLQPDKDTVDTTPNCGNMLAAVVPFALEAGLVAAQGEKTTLRVLTLNTDMQ